MPKDVELYVSRSSLRERLVDLLERSKSIIEFLKRTEIDFVREANNVGARAPGVRKGIYPLHETFAQQTTIQ